METPRTAKKELLGFFNSKVQSRFQNNNDNNSKSVVDYFTIKQDNSTILTISSTSMKGTSKLGCLRSIFSVQPTSLNSPKLLTQVTSIRGVRIEETPIAVESEKYSSGIILLVHISFDFVILRTNNIQDQLENIYPKFLRKRSKVASLLDGSFCNYELLIKNKLLRVMKRKSRPKEGITLFKNSLDLNRFIYLRKVPQSLYPDFASTPEYPVSIYCGSKPEDKNAIVGLSEDLTGFNLLVGMQEENRVNLIQSLILQLSKKYKRILVIDPDSVLNGLNTIETTKFYRFGNNIARNILNYSNLSNEERSSRLTNSLLNSIRNNSYYHYFFRIISLFQLQDKLLGPGNYSFMSMAEEMQESTLSKAGFKDQRSSDEISALFTSFGNWEEFSSHQGGEDLNDPENSGITIIQFCEKHPNFCVKLAIDYLLEEYSKNFDSIFVLSAERVIHPWKDPDKISIQNESILKTLKKVARDSPIFICSRELTVISLERSYTINNAIFLKVNQRTKDNIISSYAMDVAQNERYKMNNPSELLSFLDNFAVLFRYDAPNVPFVFTPLRFPQIVDLPRIDVDFNPVEMKTTLIFSKRISSNELGLSCFILNLSNYGIQEVQIEEQIKQEWPEKVENNRIYRILEHLDSVGYLSTDNIQGNKYSITDRGKEFLEDNGFSKINLSYSTLIDSEEVIYHEILEKIDNNDFIGIKTSIRNLLGSLINKEIIKGKKYYLLSIFKRIEELGDVDIYQERYRNLMISVKEFIKFKEENDLLMTPQWTKEINEFFKRLNFPEYPISGLLSLFLNNKSDILEGSSEIAEGIELDQILDKAFEDNNIDNNEVDVESTDEGGE